MFYINYVVCKDKSLLTLKDVYTLRFYINYVVCKIFITLKAILPKTQIIVTTHSPHILQIDSKEEMIVLDMAESDNVYKKELELGEYGVLGWTNEGLYLH
ncbi:Predicted ATP-binding protein involved in virulence [Clostridioides difficile]|nr:Predicted ATP-binding protein involved in virulence [Clostridioides difficile]SJV42272.1 Predicted ATP-binding protein involved in virulence [Clostridioides difficile]